MSDDHGGWGHPEQQQPPPVPPGWSPQQPPAWQQPPSWQAPPPGQQSGAQQPGAQAGWQQQPGWQQAPGWAPGPFAPPAPRPGVIPLRPLGVGEILDGAISTVRAHPRTMLGLSAIVAALTQLVSVPLTWLLLHSTADTAFSLDPQPTSGNANAGPNLALSTASLTSTALGGVVTWIATIALTGLLTVVVSRAVLGQPITGKAAWALTRPRVAALMGVTLLILLLGGLIAVTVSIPVVVLVLAHAPGVAIGLTAFLMVLLGALALVSLSVNFALSPTAVVLEKAGVRASLRRSRDLVKGAWWRTFGLLLLINLLVAMLSAVLQTPFNIASLGTAFVTGGGHSLNVVGIVPLLVSALGTILVSTLTWPFTAAATALVYVDRRMRSEGLDLELARSAAR